jgi:hypothetical protein
MMGTGMGLGLGFGLGGAFGQQMGGLSSQMRTNLQEGVPPPPPTGGPMTAPQLYLMVGGKQLGPITVAEIRALVTSGEVKGDTLVWKPGEAAWQRADGHPDLQALFRPPPANQEVTPTSIYLFIENQQAGPFSPEQVAGMVSAGKIKGDTLVWKPGFAGWVRADSQADIQKMLGTMGSPPPPPIPSGQS